MVNQQKYVQAKQAVEERVQESESLQKLRAKRQTLDGSLTDYLSSQRQTTEQRTNTQVTDDRSKLDKQVDAIKLFDKTVKELVGQLSTDLGQYVDFINQSKNFQGMEKFFNTFWMKDRAETMRTKRIQNQKVSKSLMEAVGYGLELVKELTETYKMADNNHVKLAEQVNLITAKLQEYQPQEAALKTQKESMQETYNMLEAKFDLASAEEQVTLQTEKDQMYNKLSEVKITYREVQVAYNQAQQALKPNEVTRDSYEKMREDVAAQIQLVKHKIENVTTMYETAPEAIKIVERTKGMEIFDKTVNVVTEKVVDLHVDSAAAVSDATLAREETQLIQEHVMKGFMDDLENILNDYNIRHEKVETDAGRSTTERYGPN
ncbi:MAG: hypothetical protein ABIB43_01355 [archaeon]